MFRKRSLQQSLMVYKVHILQLFQHKETLYLMRLLEVKDLGLKVGSKNGIMIMLFSKYLTFQLVQLYQVDFSQEKQSLDKILVPLGWFRFIHTMIHMINIPRTMSLNP